MHQVQRRQVFAEVATPVQARRVYPVPASRPHGHEFLEIAVVTGGSGVHVSVTGRQDLHRGSVVVVRPGEWHGYDDCRDLDLYNVFVGAELFGRELAWIREDPLLRAILWPRPGSGYGHRSARLDGPATVRLAGWLQSIEAPPGGQATERTSRLAHLLLLLGEIAPAFGAAAPPGEPVAPTHPAVLAAARLLETRLAEPWTLTGLAREVNLAPEYLARLFGRDIGAPPMAYLARVRAERAAALLIETDQPVAVIGRQVGWPDPSYASRRFRQYFGVSPTRYRSAPA